MGKIKLKGAGSNKLSACFVLPAEDSIDGIFDSIKATALIQKAGDGTGFSFSRLRPSGDRASTSGGRTEGPLALGVKGVTVYRDGCRSLQPMALGPSTPAPAQVAAPLVPMRLPESMPSLRIRQMTLFGNMHVKVSVDAEREVFAQLGKGAVVLGAR
jgi:hypothetical protein